MHDRLDHLLGVLDTDEPIVLTLRHEPDEASARLLASLGAGFIVDPVHGQPCVKACGHEECRMTTQPDIIFAGQLQTAGNGLPDWEPNIIDWRHSLVMVDKRADADDATLEICAHCGCEVDIAPAPHKPGCAGIGKPRTSVDPVLPERDGAELLARMDAGLPLNDEVLGEAEQADAVGQPATASALVSPRDPDEGSASPSTEPGPAVPPRLRDDVTPRVPAAAPAKGESGGASTTTDRSATMDNPYGLKRAGRGYQWPRETAIQAVKDFAATVGRPPQQQDARDEPTGTLPSWDVAKKLFGSWDDLVRAAGLEPAAKQPRKSEREPQAAPATGPRANGRARVAARKPDSSRAASPKTGGSTGSRPAKESGRGGTEAGAASKPSETESDGTIPGAPEPQPVAPPRPGDLVPLAALFDRKKSQTLISQLEYEAERCERRAAAFRKLAEGARELERTA